MTHKRTTLGPSLVETGVFEPIRGTDDGGVAILHGGHHSGAVGAAAVTINVPNEGARYMIVQALTQNVRYTLDGTIPTATKGFQLKAGDAPRTISLSEHTIVKVIQETAGAILEYLFGA